MHRKRTARVPKARLPSFYDAVYEVVREIPRGKVVAYGWVATWLGSPRAARAVGYALAACPPGCAPWQRVINSAGQVSVGGDVSRPERQCALLRSERVEVDEDSRVNLRTYGYRPTPSQLTRWAKRKDAIDSLRSEHKSESLAQHSQPRVKDLTMADVDKHKPPKAVQKSCERGLKLNEEGHGGKGLVAKTINWAKHMAAGKETPVMECRRMAQWFARHKVDKRPGWNIPPTPGYVAWELWGGDAGMRWANSIVERVEKKEGSGKKKTKKKAAKKKSTTSARKKKKVTRKSSGKKKSKKKTARKKSRARS